MWIARLTFPMNNQVSGAHRFKYFSNAFALPHSPPSTIFCIENEKGKEKDQELNSCPQSKFRTTAVQTKLKLVDPSIKKCNKKQKANPKEPLGGKHVRKERKIPPVSEFRSIEEYKAFLIQAQMEDIQCREEEINKDIEHRLQEKKKELEERYSKQVVKTFEKIETSVVQEQNQKCEEQTTQTNSNDDMKGQAKVKSCATLFPSRRYPTRERRETSKRKIDEHKNSLEYIESIM